MRRHITDGGGGIDPTDRTAVRGQLERFAGPNAVTEADDGTLRADFGGRTHVTVAPDGAIDTGMPLHSFAGTPERLVFDHDSGELRAELDDGSIYVFRRP
ncbi:hypothetical protein [Haloarcula argentinensis]|uniref:Uncharacterized protein n=1 Tax=Haloarcula argentinensis TaxID=43776 RepID=A0A830FRT8_HALAR|nr:hypothetical protein [Haloarcula argentinensis]EMA23741.1 hypothetical protein C443_08753 [Haloarcula argentinensis DSM 12282]MDS0252654.1 hypothetical protein [Haloarcula argentinensis]GGM30645.1 hypothetical protein GCM10009006_10180 [Haloarcula argentinensis]